MLKSYIAPSFRLHQTSTTDIIFTSDPSVGFGEGSTDTQEAPRRTTDWSSFEQ